ncbi:MAG: hypothetical protein IPK54_10295 [Dokdonella sp.]|uniref:hypothetical protein n=1 Tax=Dokdonella sp. TaxID=2291710 RepID=UPI0025BF662F|nr:hypothetical protein [Dokdonella sp.]MBK8123922.1 hypothetical protein [Dokdonella sp.]
MSITLGALTLPDGLVWSDEHAWSPIAQSTEYGLTGSLIVDEAVKQAGRPITLAGAKDGSRYTAWVLLNQPFMGFSSLTDLRAALLVAEATFTLTLHDGRMFTVMPRHDGEGPIRVMPLAGFATLPPASPPAGWTYALDELRLIVVT